MPPAFTDPAATWDARYAGDDYVFGREPNTWLSEQVAHLKPGGRALCVADGEGRNSVWLARQGLQVQAFDVSPVAVAKARRLAAENAVAVDFQVADADTFAWPVASCDAVVAIFVQFAEPPLRDRMFAAMVRALAPGGVLLLQGYTPKQLEFKTGGPGELSHLYTPALLREAFAALEIVTLDDYEADLTEGARHAGRSALIGMVARRSGRLEDHALGENETAVRP